MPVAPAHCAASPVNRGCLAPPPLPLLFGHAAVSDIYPEGVQLKKGEYVLRAMLRHDDAALLGKLKASWGEALCSQGCRG